MLVAVYMLESLCHPCHLFVWVVPLAIPENNSVVDVVDVVDVFTGAGILYFPGAHIIQVPPSVVLAPARCSPGKQSLFQGLHPKAFSVFENLPVEHAEHCRSSFVVPFLVIY